MAAARIAALSCRTITARVKSRADFEGYLKRRARNRSLLRRPTHLLIGAPLRPDYSLRGIFRLREHDRASH